MSEDEESVDAAFSTAYAFYEGEFGGPQTMTESGAYR